MQQFDISIDRVDKIPVPLLVIGLGGTGCDVLQTVKRTFAERYVLPKAANGDDLPAPAKTAYLGIDSLSNPPDGLDINEYCSITIAGLDKLLADQGNLLKPFEHAWVNQKLRHSTYGNGIGTVRQAARLALSRNYDAVYGAITGALRSIVATTAGASDPRVTSIEIVIVTGIGGGTGSGIFLDVAQIVRQAARETSVIPAIITGYVVMPDVSLANVAAASGMQQPIKHNAYAALKELDFWMRVRQHRTPYTMQYGAAGTRVTWSEPPFDHCILMSCSNVYGVPYRNGYETVRNTIAENLMHYLAKEAGTTSQYSYRQYEDNLSAVKNGLVKSYPLNYNYRAIGAFTKRIPKKSILYYEGKKLFETFIPLRDDEGHLQPDRRMFTDGQTARRAEGITGSGRQLLQDFSTNVCKLPNFCYLDITDNVKVVSVQNMNQPPHSKWHTWRDTISAPAALKAAEDYLDKAWERFSRFAESVITDPEQGPFALEKYLDAEDGLMSALDTTLNSWTVQRGRKRDSIRTSEDMCANSWPSFRNPPILGKRRALEQYVADIATLYTYVNDNEFLESHVDALSRLILRIKEYIRDGLKPLCASILYLEGEFQHVEVADEKLVQDIYSLSDVQGSIDNAFKECNANNALSAKFLGKLTEISLQTEKNADPHTSGVQFLCRNSGMYTMCSLIQQELEENFGSVNSQSLDDIMIAQVGTGVSAQNQWIQTLTESVLNSALPMFLQDSVFAGDEKAPYSYLSIPDDAPLHFKQIQTAFATHDPAVEPKASSLKDHVYCLMAWDGLPLYRYGMMEELRQAYADDVDKDGFEGIHLVRSGNPDADYTEDWAKLPSPKPYFLFNSFSVPQEMAAYQHVRDLAAIAMEGGMLTVDDTKPYVSAELRQLYAPNGIALMTADTIRQSAEEISREIDPATGDRYPGSVINKKLEAFLASGKTVLLEETNVRPQNLASVLGLSNEPCDPFDPAIMGDVDKLRKAKENHKKLCTVMVEAILYSNPALVRGLELQAEAYREIKGSIAGGDIMDRQWQKRVAYADTAASVFIYLKKAIFLGPSGYRYRSATGVYDIVTGGLLAEDLADVSSHLLKTAAFLADVPDDNLAKSELTEMLTTAKNEFNFAQENGNLTAEDVAPLIDSAAKLIANIQKEKDACVRAAHINPAKKDQFNHQIDVYSAMSTAAQNLKDTLQAILDDLA